MSTLRSLLPGRPFGWDVVIAAVAAVFVSIGTFGAGMAQEVARPPDAGALACAVLAAGALAWRRGAPLFCLGSAALVAGVYLGSGYAYGPVLLCVIVAMFETARQRGWTTSLPACALGATAVAVAILFRETHGPSTAVWLIAAWGSWLIIPWSLGSLAHLRASAAQRARRDLAERARLEERMRVASEVHDIAGHGFAATAMQAGVALLVLDERPDQARRSLEAIHSTSTKALDELRTMLDTFYPHRDEPSDTETASGMRNTAEPATPEREGGLADLVQLVDTVRAGGLPVELEVEHPRSIPENVENIAYRVVRESLTNVLRHAGPTTASVRVYPEGTDLITEIADHGHATGEITEGRGLTGMRQHVTAVGGTLRAQANPEGGFRVTAWLPLAEAGA